MNKLQTVGLATALMLVQGVATAATMTIGNNWTSFNSGANSVGGTGTATYTDGTMTFTVEAIGGALFYNGTTTLGARDYIGVGTNVVNGAISNGEGLKLTFDYNIELTGMGLSQWENCCESAQIVYGGVTEELGSSDSQQEFFNTRDYWDFANLEMNEMVLQPSGGLPAFYLFELSYDRVSPVPLPAAAWLFGSALLGLAGIKRKKK